eukprot:m.29293 g.29293  ORF g.29293 m.29293 type:complete len:199 (+) comp9558_c0_seq1:587-1183(+)
MLSLQSEYDAEICLQNNIYRYCCEHFAANKRNRSTKNHFYPFFLYSHVKGIRERQKHLHFVSLPPTSRVAPATSFSTKVSNFYEILQLGHSVSRFLFLFFLFCLSNPFFPCNSICFLQLLLQSFSFHYKCNKNNWDMYHTFLTQQVLHVFYSCSSSSSNNHSRVVDGLMTPALMIIKTIKRKMKAMLCFFFLFFQQQQ